MAGLVRHEAGPEERDDSQSTATAITRCTKTIFAAAVKDVLISRNPFIHLSGTSPRVDKDWHNVSHEDLQRLLGVCDSDWRALFSLCRLAGLRRGEALRLRWTDVDWIEHRLTVVPEDGRESTKQYGRVVPIEHELHDILLETFDQAAEGQELVVNVDGGNVDIMARRRVRWAGFEVWLKPFHTLRKNRETDWAQQYPQYVVAEWMGHSIEVAAAHYLKVPEELYRKAAGSAAECAAVTQRNRVKGIEESEMSEIATARKVNLTQEPATICSAFHEYPRQGSNLQPSAPEAHSSRAKTLAYQELTARAFARAADALHDVVTDPEIRVIVDQLIRVGPRLDASARKAISRAIGLKGDPPR